MVVEGLVIFGAVAGFEVLAVMFGKNSRDGRDWSNPPGPHMEVHE